MSGLPQNLISDFVKSVTDDNKKSTPTTAYGTIVMHEGEKKVLLDGSDAETEPIPLVSTVLANPGDRVKVTIQNHYAIIDGNITSPAVNKDGVIASINLSGETATISASKIDLKGVATFSNGGGVNFLRNTGHVQTWRQMRSSTSKFIDDRTIEIYEIGSSDDWNSAIHTWPRFDTAELFGKTITLSFRAMVSARYTYIDSTFGIAFSTSTSSAKDGARTKYQYESFSIPTSTAVGTWRKFTYTIENVSADFFSLGSGNVGGYFYLQIYNRSPNKLKFKDFKIEEGHVATTWSPSPLDDNYSVVEDGVTVIDGGKIKTGSITANQIKAGTITGAEIKAGSITAGELDVESIFARDIFARGYISFQNSKYNFTASDVTGNITIEGKTNGSDITIRAKKDLIMTNDGGNINISAAQRINLESGNLGEVYLTAGTKAYHVGGYSYLAGTNGGTWSYKKWMDGTVDLWLWMSVSTSCPNNFGGITIGNTTYPLMKMSDPISIPDYPFTLASVRDTQMYFQTRTDGVGAFVWSSGVESRSHPGDIRLVRPTNVTVAGYVYVSVKGVV